MSFKSMYICILLLFSINNSLLSYESSSCIAHRGYSAKFLENSQESFLQAYLVGAKNIELDVHHTSDGVGIIHHDATPKRTAKSKVKNSCKLDTPFKKQTFLDIRNNCVLNNGEDIISLKELLSLFSNFDTTIFVELKDLPSIETLDLIHKYKEIIVVISFHEEFLDLVASKVSRKGSQLNLIYLSDDPVKLSPKYHGLGTKHLSLAQINDLKSKNKITNIWTVNDPSQIKSYFGQGIDYVTSDEIELCLGVLNEFKHSQSGKDFFN